MYYSHIVLSFMYYKYIEDQNNTQHRCIIKSLAL